MAMNFIRGNRVKKLSLLDFYLLCSNNKNPLGIYNATRTIIELNSFINDIKNRLSKIYILPESDWKNKGSAFFNTLARARYGTNNPKFQKLFIETGVSSKKIKPINISESISFLKKCGHDDLAYNYGEMCEFVHHNLSSNTTANFGSKVYDHYAMIDNKFGITPGSITTVYCYPIEQKANKAI